MRFIDAHRETYEVEPICAVLLIAPSTYYETKALERDVTRRSARSQHDATLMPEIQLVWDATRRRYGAKKVWRELLREGLRVARCMIAVSSRRWACAACCADGGGAGRSLPRPRPIGRMASCSETSRRRARTSSGWPTSGTWAGFLYLAVVFDVFSRRIVDWAMDLSFETALVLDALNRAVGQRAGARTRNKPGLRSTSPQSHPEGAHLRSGRTALTGYLVSQFSIKDYA